MSSSNDMLTFLAVAETGSFTLAAEILKTPKSNVSRKITKLENELDVRLLERTTRSINLTEAGRIYLEHCQRIKEEIEGARQNIEQLKSRPSGTLKICTSVTAGQFLLAQQFIQFQQQHPTIKLDVELNNRRVDIIEEGFDVVFRVGESSDSNLISKRLCSINLQLYGAPKLLSSQPLNNIDALKDYPTLYMSNVGGVPHLPLLSANAGKIEQSITPVFISNDFNLLFQACTAGNGLALLPSYMCRQAVANKELIKVLPDIVGRKVDIYAIYPSRKGKLPKLTALLDFMVK